MKKNISPRMESFLVPMVQALFYAGYTSYFTFIMVYLSEAGYTEASIGLVMTLANMSSIVFDPLFGYLADTRLPIRKIIAICLGVTAPLGFLLPAFCSPLGLAILSVLVLAIFEMPLLTLIDTWTTITTIRNDKVSYGTARGLGSLSAAVAALFLGSFFDQFGASYLFVFHGIFMGAAAIVALVCGRARQADTIPGRTEQVHIPLGKIIGILAHNKRYVYFAVSGLAISSGLMALNTYLPLMVKQLGGSTSHVGMITGLGMGMVVPFLFLYGRLAKRFSHVQLYTVAGICMTVRFLIVGLSHSFAGIVCAQLISGIALGLYYPAVVLYLCDVTPLRLRATGITIQMALGGLVCGFLGNFVAGVLIERIGYNATFLAAAALCAFGTVIFLYSLRYPIFMEEITTLPDQLSVEEPT